MFKFNFKESSTSLVLNVLLAIYIIAEILYGHTLISQACMLLFVGATILMCAWEKMWNVFLLPYLVLILWSVLMISLGNVISQSNAVDLTRTMVFNLIFLLGFTMYYKTVGNVEVVFQTYKISAVFACMPILIMGAGSALSGGRLQNTGINSNFLGTFVAIAFLILIYQIIGKKKTNILLNFFQIILFSSVILLSGSRSALLMVAICAYVLWVYRKPKRFIINSLLVIATVGVVLYVLLNVGFLYDLVGNRVEDLIVYVQVGEVDDNSLIARARFIETGWERFIKNPYLGYGADCFRTIAAGQYAHNNFIELLFSFGIISILYYIPFVYCVVMVVRYHKHYFSINRDLFLFTAGIIVAILVCDYSRVTYYERIHLLPLNIAILTIVSHKPKKAKSEE